MARELHPLRLMYVLARYPAPTETFISREIAAVQAAGVEVWIYAFRQAAAYRESAMDHTTWRQDLRAADIMSSFCYALQRRPAAFARALAGLARLAWRPRYAVHAWRNAIYALPLVRRIDLHEIDRIHGHFADIPADVALFLSRATGTAYSFSAHARDVFVRSGALRAKCDAADVVFACNRDAADELRRCGAKVELLHHGLDFGIGGWERIYRERSAPRAGRTHILAVGRFVPKKGFDVLIEALAILRSSGLRCSATIAGGGPERDRLLRLIHERDLGSDIQLLDFLDHDALSALWKSADIFVQASVVAADGDRDGIPNTVLEAMACGVPVVASALAGITEVVREGETGYIAPPGDPAGLAGAIRRAFASSPLATVAAARELVQTEFDVRVSATRMLEHWGAVQLQPAV